MKEFRVVLNIHTGDIRINRIVDQIVEPHYNFDPRVGRNGAVDVQKIQPRFRKQRRIGGDRRVDLDRSVVGDPVGILITADNCYGQVAGRNSVRPAIQPKADPQNMIASVGRAGAFANCEKESAEIAGWSHRDRSSAAMYICFRRHIVPHLVALFHAPVGTEGIVVERYSVDLIAGGAWCCGLGQLSGSQGSGAGLRLNRYRRRRAWRLCERIAEKSGYCRGRDVGLSQWER